MFAERARAIEWPSASVRVHCIGVLVLGVDKTIGGYEIVAKLKSGGMAAMYLARRRGAAGFARHVAIKVVHPHLAEDRSFVQMFVDEAKLSARIDHPNVVHIEEFGEFEGAYFLVMEYVHGCSLGQLLRELAHARRRLAPAMAVYIVSRIADGLHAAHETTDERGRPLGVVHRDVSPQNVLLSYKGQVKVIDFGVAKTTERSRQTTGISLKGKIRYMSPEQARGHAIDRRSDVYSLGVVMWELLTMRALFSAPNDLALLDLVRQPNVSPPTRHVSSLASALESVVMDCLASDPALRPPTAMSVRRRLADAVPQVRDIDDAQLAAVLRQVVSEKIELDRHQLPESLSGLMLAPPDRSTNDVTPESPRHVPDAADAMTIALAPADVDALDVVDDVARPAARDLVPGADSERAAGAATDGPPVVAAISSEEPATTVWIPVEVSASGVKSAGGDASSVALAESSSRPRDAPRRPWVRRATQAAGFLTGALGALIVLLFVARGGQGRLGASTRSAQPGEGAPPIHAASPADGIVGSPAPMPVVPSVPLPSVASPPPVAATAASVDTDPAQPGSRSAVPRTAARTAPTARSVGVPTRVRAPARTGSSRTSTGLPIVDRLD